MLNDMLTALALLLIIEGMLPFLAPAFWKTIMRQATQFSDTRLRIFGLVSMLGGLLILFWVS